MQFRMEKMFKFPGLLLVEEALQIRPLPQDQLW